MAATSPQLPLGEVALKCEQQKSEFVVGAGNPGKNIRSYMESVRNHGVVLDPTVMVALMSMMVLEGWQSRLDPQVIGPPLLVVTRHYSLLAVTSHNSIAVSSHHCRFTPSCRFIPQVSIMDCLAQASSGGIFGRMTQLNQWVQGAIGSVQNAFGRS